MLKRSPRKGRGSTEEEAINSARAVRGPRGDAANELCLEAGTDFDWRRRWGSNKGEERTS